MGHMTNVTVSHVSPQFITIAQSRRLSSLFVFRGLEYAQPCDRIRCHSSVAKGPHSGRGSHVAATLRTNGTIQNGKPNKITRATGIIVPLARSGGEAPANYLIPTLFTRFLSSSPTTTFPLPISPTLHIHIPSTPIMTRTERSQSLRALIKDRSEARNGMDSSLPKGGAGSHNWGSLESEYEHETAAMDDETGEPKDQAGEAGGKRRLADVQLRPQVLTPCPAAPNSQPKKPAPARRTSSVTDEDRENALKIRKNALKSNGGTFSC